MSNKGGRRGRITEQKAATILMEHGYNVSEPLDPSSSLYDFIADNGTQTIKLQVKLARVRKRYYEAKLEHLAGNKRMPYVAGSFDYFVIQLPGTDTWYIIPLSVVLGRLAISLGTVGAGKNKVKNRFTIYRNNWAQLDAPTSQAETTSHPAPPMTFSFEGRGSFAIQ
jgi:hypothetical protein